MKKILRKIIGYILSALKYLALKSYSLLKFILWCLLTPVDMIITIFNPNTRFHSWISGFYYQNVRSTLTKDISARVSYTFAHGFVHVIIFIIVALCSWTIFNKNSSVVKNKYIKISTYSKTGHKFEAIHFNWAQTWELDEDSLSGAFYIGLIPDLGARDSAHYYVCVKSNFDLQPDTSLFPTLNHIEYNVITCEPRIIEIEMNRPYLQINESPEEFVQGIKVFSNAKLFDDDDTPYVNFYVSFDCQALAPDRSKENSYIDIYFNTEFKDGFANMPYDIQTVKPEPRNNCPWWISYWNTENEDAINEVLKNGLYISTVNRDLKQKKDREAFLYSVLLGALISFLFSILIDLFTKWRNLNMSEGRPNPYSPIHNNLKQKEEDIQS